MSTYAQHGTGPGEITADGCSVELYARLPDRGEAEVIHAAIAPGADVLDLGCGTGRIAAPLVRLGHRVVGVDTSEGMLDHARAAGVETVQATIEDVRLEQGSFGAVLLASHLINNHDLAQRDAFLATARHHLAADGALLVQRHRPGWIAAARDSDGTIGGIRTQLRVLGRPGPDLLTARITYELDEGLGDGRDGPDGGEGGAGGAASWTQEFTTREVDDAAMADILAAAGLRLVRYVTEERDWALAVLAP